MSKIEEYWSSFKTGIYNLWFFLPVVWKFRWWDYSFNLELLNESLKYSARETETEGNKVRSDEIAKEMRDVIHLLDRVRSSDFIEEAERIVGYELKGFDFMEVPGKDFYELVYAVGVDKEKSKEVCRLARELEENNWNKIWNSIRDKMQGWWD